MLKISFRNWVRARLRTHPRVSAHDRGYLDTMPWLEQLIPLRKRLSGIGSSSDDGIDFSTMEDLLLRPENHKYHRGFFVTRAGLLLGATPLAWDTHGISGKHVLRGLEKLDAKSRSNVAYMVGVFAGFGSLFQMRIFKFPKEIPRLPYVGDLLREKYEKDHPQEAAKARKEAIERTEKLAADLAIRARAREEAAALLDSVQ